MACVLVAHLNEHATVHQDRLAAAFAADFDLVAEQAALSAEVTHAHPEGIDGAIAVALAAALATRHDTTPDGLLTEVIDRLAASDVRSGLQRARHETAHITAARHLGNGSRTTAADTVPFCLWVAAHHLDDYRRAFWTTASAGGDIDTTCAIVGGIVAARTGVDGIPATWLAAREPLPARP